MATTSIDGAVRGWDLRVAAEKHRDGVVSMGTASVRLADWGDAGTQVKWNRQHDHILASAHGNNICVWDTRVSEWFATLGVDLLNHSTAERSDSHHRNRGT